MVDEWRKTLDENKLLDQARPQQGLLVCFYMYAIFVNNLHESVEQCQVKQHVGDTAMFRAADSVSELEKRCWRMIWIM